MKKFLACLLIISLLPITCAGCSLFEEEQEDTTVVSSIDSFPEDKEEVLLGSENYPAVATEGFTIAAYEGSFDYKVTNIYAGEDCNDKLTELGEDLGDYYWNDHYKRVLYQVEVKVNKVSKNAKKVTLSDIIFSELYKPNKKDQLSGFFNVGIVDDASKDINQGKISLKKSDDPVTLYQMVEVPEGIDDFYSKVYDKDGNDFWIKYSTSSLQQ